MLNTHHYAITSFTAREILQDSAKEIKHILLLFLTLQLEKHELHTTNNTTLNMYI